MFIRSTYVYYMSIKMNFIDMITIFVDFIDTSSKRVDFFRVFRQVWSICRWNRPEREPVGEMQIIGPKTTFDAAPGELCYRIRLRFLTHYKDSDSERKK